jgi:hypothetical protein
MKHKFQFPPCWYYLASNGSAVSNEFSNTGINTEATRTVFVQKLKNFVFHSDDIFLSIEDYRIIKRYILLSDGYGPSGSGLMECDSRQPQ